MRLSPDLRYKLVQNGARPAFSGFARPSCFSFSFVGRASACRLSDVRAWVRGGDGDSRQFTENGRPARARCGRRRSMWCTVDWMTVLNQKPRGVWGEVVSRDRLADARRIKRASHMRP